MSNSENMGFCIKGDINIFKKMKWSFKWEINQGYLEIKKMITSQ